MPLPFFLIAVLLTGVSAVFLIVGIRAALIIRRELKSAAFVTGEIIGFEKPENYYDIECPSFPVVRFQAQNGEVLQFRAKMGTSNFSRNRYSIGECVKIRYNPLKPADAAINDFTQNCAVPLVFSIIGAGGLLVMGSALVSALKH